MIKIEINELLHELSCLALDDDSYISVISKYIKDTKIDKFLHLAKKSNKSESDIVLCYKIDKPEFIVNDIYEYGIIEAIPIMPLNLKSFLLQDTIIFAKEKINGIITSIQDDSNYARKDAKIYIDTGIDSNILKTIIKLGDSVYLKEDNYKLNAASTIISNRKDTFILLIIMGIFSDLYKNNINITCLIFHDWEGLHCFLEKKSVEMETKIIIMLDTSDLSEDLDINKGPIIYKNPYISFDYSEKIRQISEINQIPYQVKVQGSSININRINMIGICNRDIPTIEVDLPIQYGYSVINKCSLDDIKCMIALITKFILQVNDEKLRGVI